MVLRFFGVFPLVCLLMLQSACATSPSLPVGSDHVLLDDKSTKFYIRTLPIPADREAVKIVRKVEMISTRLISFPEFLRQMEPHHLHGHFYLMDYSRSIEEGSGPSVKGDWIRPVFGKPYRYHYKGTVVVLRAEWEKMKADEQKKIEKETRKAAQKRLMEKQLLGHGNGGGPDGGKILQEDSHALTEVLPSGAYIVHPASELEHRGFHFVSGHWVQIHPEANQ
ncbi:MAG: hypothetical protein ACYCYP_05700 [Leptospirales bacterium]